MSPYRRFRLVMGMIVLDVAFLIGIVALIKTHTECAGYVKTEAEIVSVGKPGDDDIVTYSYIVNGETVKSSKKELFGSSKNVGDRVTVRYDPQNPTVLEDRSATKFLFISTPLLGIGAVIYTLLMIRRRR